MGFNFTTTELEKLVKIFKLLAEKGGDTDLKSLFEIEQEVLNPKEPERQKGIIEQIYDEVKSK